MGVIFGSGISAVATQYYTPYVCFAVNMIPLFFLMVEGCRMTEELETNKYAVMVDPQE
jgi:hypothetical protein